MRHLLLLATHAIQYQTPVFRCLQEQLQVDLLVVFLREPAFDRPDWDPEFGRYVQWDIPLSQGFRWSTVPPGSLLSRLRVLARLHRQAGRPPIMLTGWSTPLHWLIWTCAILARIPVLQCAETNRLSYSLRSRPLWRHLWLRFLIRRTSALLCIGQRNREFYEWMRASAARFFSYPYGVDNERFQQSYRQHCTERAGRLAELGLDPVLPVLLFCGKLIRKKRPDLLLQAVAAAGLAQRVNVLFVGEGELRPQLEAQVAELGLSRVAFLGFLNQSQMPLAYALGELLCLLSDSPSETWGLVVNEALACGRPVLVSESCGCVPDLVAGRGTGWIVPPGDLASTAQALTDALEQRAVWPAMGERGQAVVANHAPAAMARGVVSALQAMSE